MENSNQAHRDELANLLAACTHDSTKLLQLEQQIDASVNQKNTNNVFLYLAQFIAAH